MMTTAVKQNMQVLLNGIVNVMHSLTIFMLFFTCSPPSTDPVYHKSKKFIVFEECLLSLFKKCQNCGNAESTTTTTIVVGTFLNVTQTCSTCLSTFKWDSQPMIKQVPAGNLLFSAAVLFSGSLPAKVFKLFEVFGCATISRNTYFRHQEHFLQPCVFAVWNHHQDEIFKQLRRDKKPLVKINIFKLAQQTLYHF